MKTFSALLFSFILFFSFSASGQVKEKKNNLNGKTFSVKLTLTNGERKGWQWDKDELSFQSGQFISKVMSAKEKFRTADYTFTGDSSASEKEIGFECTANNPGGSEIKWNGTVTGKNINGTAVWSNQRGTFSYSFSGKLK